MGEGPSPQAPRVIEAYGRGGFRIGGVAFRGSMLVLPDRVEPWPVSDIAELTVESLAPVRDVRPGIEILLIGCGIRMAMIAPSLRQAMRDAGLVIDAMDTGAACRTYNVLLAEERRVAAALIAVG